MSVVIPTYNRRELVRESIESVLEQERTPDEVIVIDDGSTDGTSAAVRQRFGTTVRVVEQENQGPSAARNAGIALATGDVVGFNDSDNRWYPNHVSTVTELFAAHPESVLVATQRLYQFGDERIADAVCENAAIPLIAAVLSIGLMTTVAARRDALLAVGGFIPDMWYGEDVDLFLRLSLQGPFTTMRGRTVEHRISEDSLFAKGRRSGDFSDTFSTTGHRLLDLLEGSTRPDADALRNAARARIEFGTVYRLLMQGSRPAEIRPHIRRARRLAPVFDRDPSSLAWLLPSHMPDWERPRARVRKVVTLAAAAVPPLNRGSAKVLYGAACAGFRSATWTRAK